MREFLKGLELEKDVIDKIMSEHGKHLTGLNEQIDNLKKQNENSEKEIANYKSEVEKLNGSIEEKDKSLENLQSVTNENKELKTRIKISDSGVKKEFSKLKNIVRKNANTEGELYVGDTFECDEKMAEYLTGENALKKVVVKIIEVQPKKENDVIEMEMTLNEEKADKIIEKANEENKELEDTVNEIINNAIEVKPKATIKKKKTSKKKVEE